MVFADAESIETDLIGKLNLFEQVAQPLGRRNGDAGFWVLDCCGEAVDSNLHGRVSEEIVVQTGILMRMGAFPIHCPCNRTASKDKARADISSDLIEAQD